MKTSYKFILKINPNYINKINESEIDNEILLYALENGYDFSKDYDDKFCKFDIYVNWNLKNKKDFINDYIRSKHFSFDKISEDNKIIIDEIFKTKPSLLIKCIEKDIKFINYLSKDCVFDDVDFNSLVWVLKNNSISYSMLNEDFLIDNYKLGLEFLKLDFSNIVNFKKYISNYKNYVGEILDCFRQNVKNNIKYLNEINDLELDNTFKENIIDVLKEEGILLNSQTPSFIFDNEYVVRNLLLYDLNNSRYIEKEVNLTYEEEGYIINKINEDNINFDEIPGCFKNHPKIVFAILKNNINIIDNKNFDCSLYLDMIVNFIRVGEYRLNFNTKKEVLEYIGKYFLEQVLDLDFNNIKYFENLDVVYLGNQKNLYEVLKNNGYEFSELNKIFKANPYIIKECLNKGVINVERLDLSSVDFSGMLREDIVNFEIYVINLAKENAINNNETINKWENEILSSNKKNKVLSSNFYVGNINDNSLLSYPNDVKEIFFETNDVASINLLIDRVKASNNNIEKIVIDLPDELYSKKELESIKDKNLVVFGSKNDLTRISVEEMIKIDDTLDLFVSDIKKSDLSPFERYIVVYNIVKSFKKYRFYNDDEIKDRDYSDQSRNIYLIMQNDYMVCVGYARLLETLLKRVGINCIPWDVVTNSSSVGHERNYINIVDPKYDIDGYYMCDATWDKIQDKMMENGYDHLHLTTNDTRKEYEFNKSVNSNATLNDDIFNDYTDEELFNYLKEGTVYKNNFVKLKEIMKKLDPTFYYKIYDKELNIELVKEINKYLKTKLNNEIIKEKDIKAIFEINQFIEGKKYSVEEYTEKWNDFVIDNYYSDDMLIGNYKADVKKYYDSFKDMKLKDYFNLFNDNSLSKYKRKCFNEAVVEFSSQFLKPENNTYFGIGFKNNVVVFDISIDGDLFRNNKIDDVKFKLEELGYKVEFIGSSNYNIILSNEYLEKTFLEVYTDLEVIKNDYLKVYNDVLNQGLSK